MRLQEQLCRTCCCSSAASPAGKRGTGATTLAGGRPSFPLPVPLGCSIRQTRICRASKGKSCTTSQPGLASQRGPLLYYLTPHRSEVYSKRTNIMFKIKLVSVQRFCTYQTRIKQTVWHLPALMSHSHIQGCFVTLLPPLELHPA